MSALETSTRIAAELGIPPAATREFDAYLVAHEEAFMILSNAFFGSLTAFEFLDAQVLTQF